MGFTYAVQVPVGKELQARQMIINTLERYNPGIIAVNALETFTQIFKGKNTAPKQLKAKVPGYIFVTTQNTENFNSRQGGNLESGLGMEPSCWQLLKRIPFVRRILNQYIKPDELNTFFDVVDLEPEIQISTEDRSSKKDERPLVSLAQKALEYLQTKKTEAAQQAVNMLKKVVGKPRGKRSVYTIPFSLFELTRDRIDPEKEGEVRTLTDAEYILPHIAETIRRMVPWAKL